jgi:hypothetical protein
MDPVAYFRDLSAEFQAVQNRIRQLIGSAHWPSDGAWKESVLRSALRGYLPPSLSVASGFILTPSRPSTQVDILILNHSAPILFRDGDFVVATPDAVCAAIEVKTSVPKSGEKGLNATFRKLNGISLLFKGRTQARPFIGLFSYSPPEATAEETLQALWEENGYNDTLPITALSFGDTRFCRFWTFPPGQNTGTPYFTWHAYDLPKQAQGYFIHNVMEHIYPGAFERAQDMWYPPAGKEPGLVATKKRDKTH